MADDAMLTYAETLSALADMPNGAELLARRISLVNRTRFGEIDCRMASVTPLVRLFAAKQAALTEWGRYQEIYSNPQAQGWLRTLRVMCLRRERVADVLAQLRRLSESFGRPLPARLATAQARAARYGGRSRRRLHRLVRKEGRAMRREMWRQNGADHGG